jgi:hypothetical protein
LTSDPAEEGSLAIVGATALADAFQKHPGNIEAAF